MPYTLAMKAQLLHPDYLTLTVSERIQLAEDIWDSVVAEGAEPMALASAESDELRRRRQQHHENPSASIPWGEVRAKLFAKRG